MNKNIIPITDLDIPQVTHLVCECFIDDPFYSTLNENVEKRVEKIQTIFNRSIPVCRKYGYAYCIKDKEYGNIIAFSIWFDYNKLKNNSKEDFEYIFNISNTRENTYYQNINHYINQSVEYFYLLAIGVKKEYRRQGYATEMVKLMQDAYPQYNLFSDISNLNSVSIYEKRGFEILEKNKSNILVRYLSEQEKIPIDFNSTIFLALPLAFDMSKIWEIPKKGVN